MKRFEFAGNQLKRNNERVFMTSENRIYKVPRTIFHRNDYHTILRISDNEFKKHFKYNISTGIYDNLKGITWGEIVKIAEVSVVDLVNDEYIY